MRPLKTDLPWTRAKSFETGIEKTLNGYLDNRQWADRVRSGVYQEGIRDHYR